MRCDNDAEGVCGIVRIVERTGGSGEVVDPLVVALVAAGVLLVAVVVLAVLLGRASSRARRASRAARAVAAVPQVSSTVVSPQPAPVPPQRTAAPALPGERGDVLIDELIALADVATTPAVRAQCARVLRVLGVEALPVAVGDAFEPQRHAVAATAPAPRADAVEHVAEVARPGWLRGGEVLRAADVVLWVAETPPRR